MSKDKMLPSREGPIALSDLVRVALGVTRDGKRIAMTVGSTTVGMPPETAEMLATDLMRYVLEVRNGGKLDAD